MEWVFALIATVLAVGCAVSLGSGVERGQRWALEIARAMGGLDARTAERKLLVQSEAEPPAEAVDEIPMAAATNRLAT